MLEDLDKGVSIVSESIARVLSRRKMVRNSVKGLFATVAAATLGQFIGLSEADASCHCTCDDCWTTGHSCNFYGHPCPPHYCPSGCTTCTSLNWCGGWCNYRSGKWVSCYGLGVCGKGYRICRDCKCPTCRVKCTCRSAIVCYYCCTSADVKTEMGRIAALSPANGALQHA